MDVTRMVGRARAAKNDQTLQHARVPLQAIKNTARTRAATVIQSTWRMYAVRRQLSVDAMGAGVVFTMFHHAPADLMRRTGFWHIGDHADGDRRYCLAYVAIDQKKHVVSMSASNGVREPEAFFRDGDDTVAMINGGFFNYQQRVSKELPVHAMVGGCRVAGRTQPSLPIPDEYVRDYVKLHFEDDSMFHAGPMLSVQGKPAFDFDMLDNALYTVPRNFDFNARSIVPGSMRHAADLNPRAALSRPDQYDEGCVRFVVGLAGLRDGSSGYSLSHWSWLLSRIDRLQSPPNSSVNLDGGFSTSLLVQTPRGELRSVAQATPGRPVANVLRASPR